MGLLPNRVNHQPLTPPAILRAPALTNACWVATSVVFFFHLNTRKGVGIDNLTRWGCAPMCPPEFRWTPDDEASSHEEAAGAGGGWNWQSCRRWRMTGGVNGRASPGCCSRSWRSYGGRQIRRSGRNGRARRTTLTHPSVQVDELVP